MSLVKRKVVPAAFNAAAQRRLFFATDAAPLAAVSLRDCHYY